MLSPDSRQTWYGVRQTHGISPCARMRMSKAGFTSVIRPLACSENSTPGQIRLAKHRPAPMWGWGLCKTHLQAKCYCLSMSTRAFIIRDERKITFSPHEVRTETVCDSCNSPIPDDSGDIAVAKFRIGSHGKHDFIVHQTCMMSILEDICREELRFLSRTPAGEQPGSRTGSSSRDLPASVPARM